MRWRLTIRVFMILALTVLLAACTSVQRSNSDAPMLPPGFVVETYAQGLRSPTAMAFGSDGALYVAQLNGGENAGSGQIVAIDAPGAAPRVVLEGVFKPTGLAWRGDELWIAAGSDLLRVDRAPDGSISSPAPIVQKLPSNGRSEGQVTLLSDDRIVFEASGSIGSDDSGRLYTIGSDDRPNVLATGLKNAYAHASDPSTGRLFTTEIGDDWMNGEAPPEEINLVVPGGDYGWPRCYADRQAATDRGGSAASCGTTQTPIATFAPHATPTGLAFYAGDDFPAEYRNALYVALWNGAPPQVVRITLDQQTDQISGTVTPFASGIGQPIALLADPRGGLLALDFAGGTIERVVYRSAN